MSRLVAGTLLLPDGTPMAGAAVYFTAKRTEPDAIVKGIDAFFKTNSSGVYSQEIENGWYTVTIEYQLSGTYPRRWALGEVVIEDGPTTTLNALIIAMTPPDDPNLGIFQQLLLEAQAARDDAIDAANAAQEAAATITPTNGPNDTTPGRLWRTNDLVKVSSPTDTTPGRVMTVPYMGLGGNSPAITSYIGFYQSQLFLSGPTANSPLPGNFLLGLNMVNTPTSGGLRAARICFSDSGRSFAQFDNAGTLSNREFWTDANLVKTVGRTDTTPNRVLQTADGGVLSESVIDLNGDEINGTQFFRALGTTNGLNGSHYHSIHVQRVKGAQSAQWLVRDATSIGALEACGVRVRGGAGAWTDVAWLYHTANTSADVRGFLSAPNKLAASQAIEVIGTFTPTAVGSSVPGNASYSVREGRFVRMGNAVYVEITLGWSGHSGQGALRIDGLPYQSYGGVSRGVLSPYYDGFPVGGGKQLTPLVLSSSSSVQVRMSDPSGGGVQDVQVPPVAGALRMSGTYTI